MFAEERKDSILKMLQENSKLLVPDLCKSFSVSVSTIRNDLREMQKLGLLQRTHGGALSIKTRYEPPTSQKSVTHLEEKKQIGKAASEFVEPGDTILIDTGTTTLEFAKFLINKENLTVVTNDLSIATYLENNSDVNIIMLGGIIKRNFHCTLGMPAMQAMDDLFIDKAFIGINSLSEKNGLMTPDINHAEIKKKMIKIASEVFLLCDSSKFGSKAFAKVSPVTSVQYIITDNKIDEQVKSSLESLRIKVKTV